MSTERPEEFSDAIRKQRGAIREQPPANHGTPGNDDRGAWRDRSQPRLTQGQGEERTSSRKEVSEAKLKMQSRLPALDDDADVGVQKQHLITRDGKADLTFTGTLLASAAPSSAPQGSWKEYRIYSTNGGKHVFSKITRSVEAEKQDTHEAEVFDPLPPRCRRSCSRARANSRILARSPGRMRPSLFLDMTRSPRSFIESSVISSTSTSPRIEIP